MGVNVGNNPLHLLSELQPIPVRLYMSKPWWLWITGQHDMERSITALVQRLGVPEEDLLLPCTFCAKFLSEKEREQFDYCDFNLIWRRGCAHGICTACARMCAVADSLLNLDATCSALEVLEKEGTDLSNIPVRCRVCLKQLLLAEKLAAGERQELFLRVRGRWRARCMLCKIV